MPHDDRSQPSGARRDPGPSRPSGLEDSRGRVQNDRRGQGDGRSRHGFSTRRHEDGPRRGSTGQDHRDGRSRREDDSNRDDRSDRRRSGSREATGSDGVHRSGGLRGSYSRNDARDGGGRRRDSHDGGGRRQGSSRREGGRDRRRGSEDSRGSARPPQRQRIKPPTLTDDIEAADLERSARAELRALGRANAENVARHLVMVQRLLNTDPQAAYAHARYAASCAGRIAVVRETTGIAAYLCGQYTEALREIRAARRLSGLDLHRAIEADCERALGHHSKALQVASEADLRQLDEIERAELAMVVSGIRQEMGQTELGLIVIEDAIRARPRDRETLRRLHSVRADRLESLGRLAEAQAIRERIGPEPEELEEDIEVFDIQDEIEEPEDQAHSAHQAVPAQAAGPQETRSGAAQAAPAQDATAQERSEADDDAGGQGTAPDSGTEAPGSFAQRVEAEMRELLGEDPEEPEGADAAEDPEDSEDSEGPEDTDDTDDIEEAQEAASGGSTAAVRGASPGERTGGTTPQHAPGSTVGDTPQTPTQEA